MILEQTDITVLKENNLDMDLTPSTKINSNWITDINVNCKTLIFLEKNIENLSDLVFGDEFLDIMPTA